MLCLKCIPIYVCIHGCVGLLITICWITDRSVELIININNFVINVFHRVFIVSFMLVDGTEMPPKSNSMIHPSDHWKVTIEMVKENKN